MKKLLILSAMCMAMTAQATILRVSNRTNSGAPYGTVSDAFSAAENGDTIMLDGSTTSYGNFSVTKRVVLIGPGFLLSENGVVAEGSPAATVGNVSMNYNDGEGSILMGLNITGTVAISRPSIVITRCCISGDIEIGQNSTNVIIHQNYIVSGAVYGSRTGTYNAPGTQVTNNIISSSPSEYGIVRSIKDGVIAYNTFTKQFSNDSYADIGRLANTGCTIERNIFVGPELAIEGCTFQNNYWSGSGNTSLLNDCTTDKAVKETTEANISAFSGKGAFAGTDPYVISGIPAGPYISDITVPTSVEQGQTLKVNVKLGVQQ